MTTLAESALTCLIVGVGIAIVAAPFAALVTLTVWLCK